MAETLDAGYALVFPETLAAEAVAGAKENFEKMKRDPAVRAALSVAETVEDIYDAIISYVDCTLDEFRALFDRVAHRVYNLEAEEREELTEEELDVVAGGGFGDWIKRKWKSLVTITAGVAAAVASGCLVAAGVVTTDIGLGPALIKAGVDAMAGSTTLIITGIQMYAES